MNELPSMESWPSGGLDQLLSDLQEQYLPSLDQLDLAGLIADQRLGTRALVSSFGTESVVLIHYVVGILPDIPILFLDTGKHFPETLAYRDELASRFNLNVVNVAPDKRLVQQEDPSGCLHASEPNSCCTLRKTFPLQDAILPFDSWISGRKRYQGGMRSAIPIIERDGDKIKINPLATWTTEDVDAYRDRFDLPRHPLEGQGYASVGCAPCTRPVTAGEDSRAGRWAAMPEKTECGIHLGPDGRFARNDRHTINRNN